MEQQQRSRAARDPRPATDDATQVHLPFGQCDECALDHRQAFRLGGDAAQYWSNRSVGAIARTGSVSQRMTYSRTAPPSPAVEAPR